MYNASKLIEIIDQRVQEVTSKTTDSGIVFGTVTSINPLKIQLDGTDRPLAESFFYLSPFVKPWTQSLRIRNIEGVLEKDGDKIAFEINSDLITKTLSALIVNKTFNADNLEKLFNADSLEMSLSSELSSLTANALDGSWSLSQPVNPVIDNLGATGPGYSRNENMQDGSYTFQVDRPNANASAEKINASFESNNANTNISLDNASIDGAINAKGNAHIEIFEEPYEDKTHRDHHRHIHTQTDEEWEGKLHTGITLTGKEEEDTAFFDQTFRLNVINNRGLKVGDYVLMLPFRGNQQYYVMEILNRGGTDL